MNLWKICIILGLVFLCCVVLLNSGLFRQETVELPAGSELPPFPTTPAQAL